MKINKSVAKKLRFIRIYASKDIRLRLTNVIDNLILADVTPSEDVSNDQQDDVNEVVTPLSLLNDNSDEFLVLMRTLPENHELKKSIRTLDMIVNKVKSSLSDVSKQLKEVLESENEEIPEGDFSQLADLLETYSNEFSEVIEFASIMENMAKQSSEEQKHKPVEHKLEKIKLGPKKVKNEDTDVGKSEEDKNNKVKKTVEKLDKLIKSK